MIDSILISDGTSLMSALKFLGESSNSKGTLRNKSQGTLRGFKQKIKKKQKQK